MDTNYYLFHLRGPRAWAPGGCRPLSGNGLLSTHKSPNYPSYFNYILNARIK